MRDVVLLTEAADAERFGGKAAGLAACIRHGFRVPPGVAMRAGSEEFDELVAVARAEGLAGERVAVRSSAIGEDSIRASFAGLLLSVLDVDLDDVPAAARQVMASATLPQALAYRRARELPDDPAVGVIVQRLVASEVSGVLFTRDPVSGQDDIVIEAGRGLGAPIVAGLVTPTGYRLYPDGELRYRSGRGKSGGPLASQQLHQLADLATRIDEAFPGGSDVEWAFERGELWVLQRRPITA